MAFTLTFVRFFFLLLSLVLPLILFLIASVIALGQWVTHLEKWNKFDGLYWSFITATTVGYGDIRPLNKYSKGLAVLISVIGLILGGIIVSVALQATTFSVEKHMNEKTLNLIINELNYGGSTKGN